MMIPLDMIAENGHNVRRTPATAEENAALRSSMQAGGLLQPVTVRPRTDGVEGFWLVFGHRRLDQARALGWPEIRAEVKEMTDAEAMAAQIAENMVRAAMPPIDCWRAMKGLTDEGYSLDAAAQALGLSDREAARLHKLGSMHKDVLAAVEKTGTAPRISEAAIIANAKPDVQRQAVKKKDNWIGKAEISWNAVARSCTSTRIPRSRARFDPETVRATVGLVFEEDLFAEPGSDEQFTTTDVEKFLECQRAAVRDDVEARKAQKERVELVEAVSDGYHGIQVAFPKGWSRVYADPKKKLKDPNGPCLFLAILPSGRDVGAVLGVIAEPPASRTQRTKAAQADGGADAGEVEDDAPPPKAENGITTKGMELIAKAKTDALRATLRDETPHPDYVLAALILAFCADNVVVRGGEMDGRWARHRNQDLARQIIDPAGNLIVDAPLYAIAAELLARVLEVRTTNNQGYGSGNAAEWIGNLIGADAFLPRFDTEEFLAQVKGTALKEVAEKHGFKATGKISDLRDTIAGSAENYRPTTFGAPGPQPLSAEEQADLEEEMAEEAEA